MLHKGGTKTKHLAKSWRCISTCPLLTKAMDLYVFGLHKEQWEAMAAPTQFMRDSSSHEFCALTLTEAIVHATHNLKSPIVQVCLGKVSAFDSALKEHIIREVFTAANNTPSQSILYLAYCLASRKTYLKSQQTVMGPICDARGVKQGGIASSKLFQLITDGKLKTLNSTRLWIPIGEVNLAALSQADDQVLLSTSTTRAQALVDIAVDLASQNNLRNVPTKTKIIITNPKLSTNPKFNMIS